MEEVTKNVFAIDGAADVGCGVMDGTVASQELLFLN